jgi:hypothetical protein
MTAIHARSVINDIVRVSARGSGFRIERIFRYGYRRFDGRTVGRAPMKETWRKLVIRDGTEAGARGALDFDLEDVLAALGPVVLTSQWRCSGLWYIANDDRDVDLFDRLSTQSDLIGGETLLRACGRVSRFIDGEFEGVAAGGDRWIIIRAVDSSFWEVFSDRQDVLDAIRARFRVVDDDADEMDPKRAFRINPAGAAFAPAIVTCVAFGLVSVGFYASTGGLLIVGAAAACAFLATFLATSVR